MPHEVIFLLNVDVDMRGSHSTRADSAKEDERGKKVKSVEREDIADNLSLLAFTHICK